MPNMLKKSIDNILGENGALKNFFDIVGLTTDEKSIAKEAVEEKYSVAVVKSIYLSLLLVPGLFFLDNKIVVSVLIPTTMVAGTAWFSVSLASIKAKFEKFGLELTVHLFEAFTLSLMMLLLSAAASLTRPLWNDWTTSLSESPLVIAVSSILSIYVVGYLLYSIFSGSLKYDVNDAMLTGQNEAAERFFKKSLSVLHNTSEVLKNGRSLHVANYSIGVAFFEVITELRNTNEQNINSHTEGLLKKANYLVSNPSINEEEANSKTLDLIQNIYDAINNSIPKDEEHKSITAILDELSLLRESQERQEEIRSEITQRWETEKKFITENRGPLSELEKFKMRKEITKMVQSELPDSEDQEMTDLRISVVLDEIANLIEEFGFVIKIG